MDSSTSNQARKIWSSKEEDYLNCLLRIRVERVNMGDTKFMYKELLNIAETLSNWTGKEITGLDVLEKLQEYRQRFNSFTWFKSYPGIDYDCGTNRVTAYREYWSSVSKLHH